MSLLQFRLKRKTLHSRARVLAEQEAAPGCVTTVDGRRQSASLSGLVIYNFNLVRDVPEWSDVVPYPVLKQQSRGRIPQTSTRTFLPGIEM
ncbi:hypothetical protein ZHAS_00020617 [Anopheles sinensis]|uniref:Uncharacterized protein n=1 Tax=Anopheles sinensis TaxID=74873 RepID=A0A084WQA3_ANOSI|nr:hypothetical protein ZHAS_00020617 [Anopheles sinensis]